MGVTHVIWQFNIDYLHGDPHSFEHELMFLTYFGLFVLARTWLLRYLPFIDVHLVDNLIIGRSYHVGIDIVNRNTLLVGAIIMNIVDAWHTTHIRYIVYRIGVHVVRIHVVGVHVVVIYVGIGVHVVVIDVVDVGVIDASIANRITIIVIDRTNRIITRNIPILFKISTRLITLNFV